MMTCGRSLQQRRAGRVQNSGACSTTTLPTTRRKRAGNSRSSAPPPLSVWTPTFSKAGCVTRDSARGAFRLHVWRWGTSPSVHTACAAASRRTTTPTRRTRGSGCARTANGCCLTTPFSSTAHPCRRTHLPQISPWPWPDQGCLASAPRPHRK